MCWLLSFGIVVVNCSLSPSPSRVSKSIAYSLCSFVHVVSKSVVHMLYSEEIPSTQYYILNIIFCSCASLPVLRPRLVDAADSHRAKVEKAKQQIPIGFKLECCCKPGPCPEAKAGLGAPLNCRNEGAAIAGTPLMCSIDLDRGHFCDVSGSGGGSRDACSRNA